jgi:hypothetical protein
MTDTQRDTPEIQSDHDVLIRLDTKMDIMTTTMDRLTTAMAIKTDDHERRIRTNETDIAQIQATSLAWRYILSFAIASASSQVPLWHTRHNNKFINISSPSVSFILLAILRMECRPD